VTNPNGFVELDAGQWEIGSSTYDDLSFAVVAKDSEDFGGDWQSRYTLDVTESFFVDNTGDVIGSMTPVLGRSLAY